MADLFDKCPGVPADETSPADRLQSAALEVARANGGTITLAQLRGLGIGKNDLTACRRAQTIIEVLPKVFRPAAIDETWDVQARAVLKWAGRGAALCSATAASIIGFPGYARAGPIQVATPGAPRVPSPAGFELVAHCGRELTGWDVKEVDGFRITSPERTVFDLGAELDDVALEYLVDDAIINRFTTPQRMKACFKRLAHKGRKGTACLRAVLERRADTLVVLDSQLESDFLKLFEAQALPLPVTRTPSPRVGRPDYYIDFAYPQWKLAIEIQSIRHHSGRAKQYADDEKANVLTSRGWAVLRFWSKDKYKPSRVAEIIRHAIAVRRPWDDIDRPADIRADV